MLDLHNHPLSNLFHLENEEEHRGHDHVIFFNLYQPVQLVPIVTYVVRSITDYTSPLVKIKLSNFILYSYRTWAAVHNKHWKK